MVRFATVSSLSFAVGVLVACGHDSQTPDDTAGGGANSVGGGGSTASQGGASETGGALAIGGAHIGGGFLGEGGGGAPPALLPDETIQCGGSTPRKLHGATLTHDGRAVRLLLGFDWVNADGVKVDREGVPCKIGSDSNPDASCCAGGAYSWCPTINPDLDSEGTAEVEGHQTTLGTCVASSVVRSYVEIYPRDAGGTTDLRRYGESRDPRDVTTNDTSHDFRVPLNRENGGSAGKINGYVTCDGMPVLPSRVNFWSNDGGSACGIQGFRAGAKTSNGFYSSNWVDVDSGDEFEVLAAGQCNAPSQKYKVVLHAPCEGVNMTRTFFVDVCAGCGPRVDVAFPEQAD